MKRPLDPFLAAHGVVILDGGLATFLEAEGAVLGERLWSARVLLDDPDRVSRAHRAFLEAGADCIATATYQATVEGFEELDASPADLFQRAADLAVGARDAFWRDRQPDEGRTRPIVAASLGPYAALLADGSEYTGHYDASDADILAFHEERLALVEGTGVDMVAWETVPNGREARTLVHLMERNPDVPAWLSVTCRDEEGLWDGTPLSDVARMVDRSPLQALGVNCTDPAYIEALVFRAREATGKPVLVYPNHGGRYDAVRKSWASGEPGADWSTRARQWRNAGAAGVGGCCHVHPDDIRAIRAALQPRGPLRAP